MSGNNTILTAAAASEHGAFDYLPKPFDIDELAALVGRALVATPQARAAAQATREAIEASGLPLIGRSDAMQDVYRVITRVMSTDLGVLIEGEPGTGKELAARAIHDLGGRRDQPFMAVGPADIPSFVKDEAAIEAVGQGTLFLDEVEELDDQAQLRLVTLLRSGRPLPRIIASTQTRLAERAGKGLFPRRSLSPFERCAPILATASRAQRRYSRARRCLLGAGIRKRSSGEVACACGARTPATA